MAATSVPSHKNWFTYQGLADSSECTLQELTATVEHKPNDARAHCQLGAYYDKQKNYAKADEEYREAIRLDPTYAAAHNNLAILLGGHFGQLEACEQELVEALKADPRCGPAHYNLAVYGEKYCGDLDGAVREYRAAIECDNEYGAAHNQLGVLISSSEPEAAEEHLRKACQVSPDNSTYHYNLAMFLEQYKKDYAGAEEEYRRTIQLVPMHPFAHNNLGMLLRMYRKDMVAAEEELRMAVRCNTRDALARSNLALLLQAKGDIAAAEHELQVGIESNGGDSLLHLALAQLYHNGKKDYAAADREYQETLKYDSTNAQAHYGRGLLYLSEGDQEHAVQSFRGAVANDPKLADAQRELGILLMNYRKDYAGAKAAFSQALKYNPTDKRSQTELEWLWDQEQKGGCIVQ